MTYLRHIFDEGDGQFDVAAVVQEVQPGDGPAGHEARRDNNHHTEPSEDAAPGQWDSLVFTLEKQDKRFIISA